MTEKAYRSAARRGLERGGSSDPRLIVRALRLAQSVEQGRHRTAQRGSSTEFYDYRPYGAGDPMSSIDWRLYGRTDRHYVRRFQHDARLTVTVALDASASMDFAGIGAADGAVTKLGLGVDLGAGVLALGSRQGDRVGLVVADSARGALRRVPASPGRAGLVRAVGALGVTRASPAGSRAGEAPDAPGTLARALLSVLEGADGGTRRGVIVLIGDAFEPVTALGRAMALASARGATPVLMRTLTPDEAGDTSLGARTLVDPETGVRVRTRGGGDVQDALAAHSAALERVCRRTGSRCVIALTDEDPSIALREAFR